MTVAAILRHKGTDVVSVPPSSLLADVARVLFAANVGAVLVRNKDGDVMGLLNERDMVRAIALNGATALSMRADDIMTTDIVSVSPHHTVHEVMGAMTENRVRHVPVIEDEALVGVVSIGDVVSARLRDQEMTVESLKTYVTG